jgi:diguanylate cyclase (GGDEF)-like protein/PAS domain S-box-containing protein
MVSNDNRPVSDERPCDSAAASSAMLAQQLQLFAARGSTGFSLTLLISLLLAFGLWQAVGHTLLLSWVVTIMVVASGGYALVWWYQRTADASPQPKRWRALFVSAAAASGLAWGLGAAVLFPSTALFYQAFIDLVLVVVAAAALPILCAVRAAYVAFLACGLLPLANTLFVQEARHYNVMGTLVLVSAATLWGVARAMHFTFMRSLELELKNAQLNRSLVSANADTQQASSEPRAQIAQFRRTKTNEEAERAQITLASMGEGVITTNVHGSIGYVNPVAEKLTGWSNKEARGLALPKVLRLIDETTGQAVADPVMRCLNEGSFRLHTLLVHRNEDEDFSVDAAVSPINDSERRNIGVVLVLHDVSEIHGVARRMSYQASHDSLTGLVNRQEFELRMTRALESARNENRQHAMCYLDLDQFKFVNDTCGHIAGDELLKQLASALQTGVRESDTLARLGGDEFGVLLEGCPLEKATKIAASLHQIVQEFRFAWQDHVFEIGASIGLVPINSDSGSLTEVISAADAACYVAKDYGRDRIHVHQPDEKAVARRHGEFHWAARIALALKEGRFRLYRQEAMALSEKAQQRGYSEILMRMHDENDMPVPTSAFLPAAKRSNLMPTIDRWVIRQFCMFFAGRRGSKIDADNDIFAINLSGQSLSDESFLDFVVDQLQRYGVAPQRICFEITETAAIANLTRAMRFISVLKDMGAHFALDDFGSGISSFAYLKNLRVDYLKIDGSFIRDTRDDPVNYAMVEIVNQIGHVMDIRTIAESVEQLSVLAKLKELGVDYAQGFAIAEPALLDPSLESIAETKAIV